MPPSRLSERIPFPVLDNDMLLEILLSLNFDLCVCLNLHVLGCLSGCSCVCVLVGVSGGTSVPVARLKREDGNDVGGPVDGDKAPAKHSVMGTTPEADEMVERQQIGTFRLKSLISSLAVFLDTTTGV